LVDRSRWRSAWVSILGGLTGLSLLVKFDQGFETAALFTVIWAAWLIETWPLSGPLRRQLAFALFSFPCSFILLFSLSTGSLAAVLPYFSTGWQLLSGYTDSMGLPGPLWQVALAIATIGTAFGAIFLLTDLRVLWSGLTPAAITAFFAYKHAIVRQDAGHAQAFQLFFAAGLLFVLVCARSTHDRRLIVILQMFSICMGAALVCEAYPGFQAAIASRVELRQGYAALESYLHWSTTWRQNGAAEAQERAALRLPHQFGDIVRGGTVDVEPWDVDVAAANGWKWRPRPIFQTYSAFTTALDRLNSLHIAGRTAADFVLLNFKTIDRRHPFLEAPLSWQALSDRYDLKLASPEWLLLGRRSGLRYSPAIPIRRSMAMWGQEIPVPESNGLLLMGPHLRRRLLGSVPALFFRPAQIYMDSLYSSGRRTTWRCVPETMAAGFVIQPFPQDLGDLRQFFLPQSNVHPADHLVSVSFHSAHTGEFRSSIPIDWWRMNRLPEVASASVRYPLEEAQLTPLWRAGKNLPQPTNAILETRGKWIEITPQTDDPQLLFELGPGLGRFHTIVVRAWFEKADRIDAFFGKQVEGRGISGLVPATRQWFDVYLNLSQNLYWDIEHGASLRFDPVSSVGPGTSVRIAAVWGSAQAAPPTQREIEFYPALGP